MAKSVIQVSESEEASGTLKSASAGSESASQRARLDYRRAEAYYERRILNVRRTVDRGERPKVTFKDAAAKFLKGDCPTKSLERTGYPFRTSAVHRRLRSRTGTRRCAVNLQGMATGGRRLGRNDQQGTGIRSARTDSRCKKTAAFRRSAISHCSPLDCMVKGSIESLSRAMDGADTVTGPQFREDHDARQCPDIVRLLQAVDSICEQKRTTILRLTKADGRIPAIPVKNAIPAKSSALVS